MRTKVRALNLNDNSTLDISLDEGGASEAISAGPGRCGYAFESQDYSDKASFRFELAKGNRILFSGDADTKIDPAVDAVHLEVTLEDRTIACRATIVYGDPPNTIEKDTGLVPFDSPFHYEAGRISIDCKRDAATGEPTIKTAYNGLSSRPELSFTVHGEALSFELDRVDYD